MATKIKAFLVTELCDEYTYFISNIFTLKFLILKNVLEMANFELTTEVLRGNTILNYGNAITDAYWLMKIMTIRILTYLGDVILQKTSQPVKNNQEIYVKPQNLDAYSLKSIKLRSRACVRKLVITS